MPVGVPPAAVAPVVTAESRTCRAPAQIQACCLAMLTITRCGSALVRHGLGAAAGRCFVRGGAVIGGRDLRETGGASGLVSGGGVNDDGASANRGRAPGRDAANATPPATSAMTAAPISPLTSRDDDLTA